MCPHLFNYYSFLDDLPCAGHHSKHWVISSECNRQNPRTAYILVGKNKRLTSQMVVSTMKKRNQDKEVKRVTNAQGIRSVL